MSETINKELINSILTKNHPIDVTLDKKFNVVDNNIQVDKDEDINDFFASWKKFNHRPSKITLFSQFDSDGVWDIIRNDFNVKDSNINKIAEIFPDPSGIAYNMKYFISITDDISISFYEFDKDTKEEDFQEIYSSNLTIFYNQRKVSVDDINNILSLFQTSMIDLNIDKPSHKTINYLHLNMNNNFELKPLELNSPVLKKDLKFYYNKEVIDSLSKSIELINSNNRGLTILDGIRGTGKTTLINYIINKLDKKIIYVPATIIEHTFTNIDFIDFIKLNPNSIFIIDDCENFFNRKVQKSNLYSINLLQILDGITSNSLNANFILSMNVEIEEIDTNLFESNNFLSNITFKKLYKSTADKLSKKLGFDIKYTNNVKLNDVIKGKNSSGDSTYY